MALGHRHRLSRRVTLGVLMIALTAGLGYLIFRQGWSPAVGQVSGVAAAVRETADGGRNTWADAAAPAKVKAAVALSKNDSALDSNFYTYDGVTTLTGKVPSTESEE